MSSIAEQLDAKLKALDARAASSLEKLVRAVLEPMETQNGAVRSNRLPPDFLSALPASSAVNLSSGLRKGNLPFDNAAARHYGEIRHQMEVQGRVLGPNDLKVAAIARTHGLTLVSADKGFSQVPGLGVEDWT